MSPFVRGACQESAGTVGETALIGKIREWLGGISPPAPEGIGDDCAIFTPTAGERLLITVDPIVYGRHFDDTVSPDAAGAKLLKRNLSDIAAMGGAPRAAVISLMLPSTTSMEWLARFHAGLASEAMRYNVAMVGGDICATDSFLGATMTLFGETVGGRFLTRSGARVGDLIAITGSLGGSIRRRHFTFEPRLAEGQWLAQRPEAIAMMDISDGIAKDLLALLPSAAAAELDADSIPISEDAREIAVTSGRAAIAHALCDGEDHELLCVIRSDDPARLLREWRQQRDIPLTLIGRLVPAASETPNRIRIRRNGTAEIYPELSGYEHFRTTA